MYPWEWPAFWDDVLRVGAAAPVGGALGLEREWKGHWAGLRTHMMVAIGCAVFVIAAIGVTGDAHHEAVTRVIQGIASGIGFLGAGTILKLDQKQEIKGLTTASSIWLRPRWARPPDWQNSRWRSRRGGRLAVCAWRTGTDRKVPRAPAGRESPRTRKVRSAEGGAEAGFRRNEALTAYGSSMSLSSYSTGSSTIAAGVS